MSDHDRETYRRSAYSEEERTFMSIRATEAIIAFLLACAIASVVWALV